MTNGSNAIAIAVALETVVKKTAATLPERMAFSSVFMSLALHVYAARSSANRKKIFQPERFPLRVDGSVSTSLGRLPK
jgi:hypothetical protein